MRKWVSVALLVATVVLALAMSAAATAHKYSRGCNSHSCEIRVCHASCKARLARKAHTASVVNPAVLARLRVIAACESGGNPAAISRDGLYRGLLQFDYGTWRSVGGSGDPARASANEQYKRGAILYARRGSAPWPICGR